MKWLICSMPNSAPWRDVVTRALHSRGIEDRGLCEIFTSIDRKDFVKGVYKEIAYDDIPLAIGQGQTISQYSLVAYIIKELELQPKHRVLEIGTGSGYQTAILSSIVSSVVTLERIKPLQESAAKLLTGKYCFKNIRFIHGDGIEYLGDDATPFDRIIISATSEDASDPLLLLLGDEGIMIKPVLTERNKEHLLKFTKSGGRVDYETLCRVRFVPLKSGLIY